MRPLDMERLPLTSEQHADPLIRRFIHLVDRVSRAEKISDPSDWTAEQRRAFDEGDSETFSKLRGYTKEEIADFMAFVETAHAVDAKYGAQTALDIDYLIGLQTGATR